MAETTVVIEGGATNKSFVLDLLDQPEVDRRHGGWADTGWIDRVRAEGRLVVAPALRRRAGRGRDRGVRGRASSVETARLLETAHGGRPQVQHEVGRPVELKLRGVDVPGRPSLQTGPHRFRVGVAAGDDRADRRRRAGPARRVPRPARRRRPAATALVTATHGPMHLVEVDGVTHRVSRDEGGVLRSPAPALVVATPVAGRRRGRGRRAGAGAGVA